MTLSSELDSLTEAGSPEQWDQLVQENAYLRELLGQFDGIAHENIELVKRIAELEVLLDLNPGDAVHLAAGRHADTTKSVLASLPSRLIGTPVAKLTSALRPVPEGMLPVLIVGGAAAETDAWKHFDASELDDVCSGMPDNATVCYVSGPMTPDSIKELQTFSNRYAIQSVQVDGQGGNVETKVWQQAVITLAQTFKPRLVLLLRLDRSQISLVPELSKLGCKVMLRCAQNELNDLIGADFRLPLAQQQDLIEAYASANLLLASSHWEREQLDIVCGHRIPTEIYVCGVHLDRFQQIARVERAATKVLFVADRVGPLGLKVVRDAAADLIGVQGISFEIIGAATGRDTVNLVHKPFAAMQDRASMFADADLLVAPLECGGFSQSLMEGLASGCACLLPEAAFGRYPPDSPFHVYKGRRGHLAEQIQLLHSDLEYRRQLQSRSRQFALDSLARGNWATWLRNCVTWLTAA
jgi:hypothetical protein